MFRNNQQLSLVGLSKFKDRGSRPLRLMKHHYFTNFILSDINTNIFLKMLVSRRDLLRHTRVRNIYPENNLKGVLEIQTMALACWVDYQTLINW